MSTALRPDGQPPCARTANRHAPRLAQVVSMVSVDLARSSIGLFEVTQELDDASRANIKGCALSAVGE
jgi:hypothetical protein